MAAALGADRRPDGDRRHPGDLDHRVARGAAHEVAVRRRPDLCGLPAAGLHRTQSDREPPPGDRRGGACDEGHGARADIRWSSALSRNVERREDKRPSSPTWPSRAPLRQKRTGLPVVPRELYQQRSRLRRPSASDLAAPHASAGHRVDIAELIVANIGTAGGRSEAAAQPRLRIFDNIDNFRTAQEIT